MRSKWVSDVMSAVAESESGTKSCCAFCGIAEIDDVKLKDCDGCDLVRYCSDDCNENHKPDHEDACKKRSAELYDELLFRQPESSHLGDCPICSLPLPLENEKSALKSCCSTIICDGCVYANKVREDKMRLVQSCPFCREPAPKTREEYDGRNMKRIEMNDPVAIHFEGMEQHNKGENNCAFQYFTKAAGLGHADAHYMLAEMYHYGLGVEKDEGKEIHHMKEAAISGHPFARHDLGWLELNNGNIERAVKHLIIAAIQGNDKSMKALMKTFKIKKELVQKEVLAATLRAHQAAVDATKSPQREKGEEWLRMQKDAHPHLY